MSRQLATEAIRQVQAALQEITRQTHVRPRSELSDTDGSRLTDAELSSRALHTKLVAAAPPAPTYGSYHLSAEQAEVVHQLGNYNYLEGEDQKAEARFKEAEVLFNGLIWLAPEDVEMERSLSQAKKYAARLQIDWGLALEHQGNTAQACRRFKQGITLGYKGGSYKGGSRAVTTRDVERRIAELQRAPAASAAAAAAAAPAAAAPAAAAPAIATPAGADDGALIVGERSWEERDKAARKRAINLAENPDDAQPQHKRARQQQLETRVAKQKSLCDVDTDTRYKELLRPAMDLFAEDQIDEAELGRRKQAARAQGAAENGDLSELIAKFDAHARAVEARAAAEKVEEAAEAALDAVLHRLEAKQNGAGPSGQAGPSGVKGEAGPSGAK